MNHSTHPRVPSAEWPGRGSVALNGKQLCPPGDLAVPGDTVQVGTSWHLQCPGQP